ncbi:MAG: DUF6465 family protein [Oscillibacter sp.]|jgi:alanyl-tRNA synthetase|nr:DUF6465 family protein [Oscillibacter sp.]
MRKKNGSDEEPIGETVARVAAAMGETAKDMARRAKPTVKKARRKLQSAAREAEPAVKAAQEKLEDAARMVKPAVLAAGDSLCAAGKKAAASLCPEMYLQWNGREISCGEAAERIRRQDQAAHHRPICSFRIYFKPEDGTAYYVINGTEGKIEL